MMKKQPGNSAEKTSPGIRKMVPLAPRTTLGLGGPADYLVEADRIEIAIEAFRWARQQVLPVAVLGGGSNIVVADRGWRGLVVQSGIRGVGFEEAGDTIRLTAAAGEPWDDIVEQAVSENLAGIECLSGIPGLVGATPIQNVGAYGQEVASVIETVQVLDLADLELRNLRASECGFGYRTSRFRTEPDRFMVVAVSYRLRRGGTPEIAYAELSKTLAARSAPPTLSAVRDAVLDLRRGKSMVIDAEDPDSRSVGSFFVNPMVDRATLTTIRESYDVETEVPAFETADGRFKIPAAWLIEKAGFAKGLRRNGVGISSSHALALVHTGGAATADLLELAREIRRGVSDRFAIELRPEPVFIGFDEADPTG